MNCYEGMYILDSSLSDERLEEVVKSITAELAEKGEVLVTDRLGRRQLTHDVKGATEGFYIVIYFSCRPEEIKNLQARYALDASIRRVMILHRKEEEIRRIQEKFSIRTAEKEAPGTEEKPALEVHAVEAPPEEPAGEGGEKPSEKAPREETPEAVEPVASDTDVEKLE